MGLDFAHIRFRRVTSRLPIAVLAVAMAAGGWMSGLVYGTFMDRTPPQQSPASPDSVPAARLLDARPGQPVEVSPDGQTVYQVALARITIIRVAADGHLAVTAQFTLADDPADTAKIADTAAADAEVVGDDGRTYPAEVPDADPETAYFDLPPGVKLTAVEWDAGADTDGDVARWRIAPAVSTHLARQQA